jgi:hypothetical protein
LDDLKPSAYFGENDGLYIKKEYYDSLQNIKKHTIEKIYVQLLDNEKRIKRLNFYIDRLDKATKNKMDILYEIEDNGLNILHATSIVDSYALANAADIVITFGSQLSVESAFLGKYVIVLGSNMYSSFNFCRTCYSIQSAIDIIINLKQNIRNDFENQNVRIEEACLHMYARYTHLNLEIFF